ncbi:multiple ankyrin repeats single kh domain protein [Apiospora kogelbergensis]|uniref:multiple ankyrin repeats single kh domain protein n=1 Tax=Apiospora kogelbergensis TaxID=1337665 RepID=UPI00312F7517
MPDDTYSSITLEGESLLQIGDNNTYNYGTSHDQPSERDQLREFLLPNPQCSKNLYLHWDHEQAKQRRCDETGEWLLKSDEFKSWKDTPMSFMWIKGIPGSGKTVLRYDGVRIDSNDETDLESSVIIDRLKALSRTDHHTAGYYFKAMESEKRTVSRMLRCLLLQLCPTKGNLPDKVKALHTRREAIECSSTPLFEGLESLMMERSEPTYIVIDALDECDTTFDIGKTSEAEELAKVLRQLVHLDLPVHILVTSRSEGLQTSIKRVLADLTRDGTEKSWHTYVLDLQSVKMEDKIRDDIMAFIEHELQRWNNDIPGQRRWLPLDDEKKQQITGSIKVTAGGMFRLAACLLDLLLRAETWTQVKEDLTKLPTGITEVYDRIFLDLNDKGSQTATILIRWLLFSRRPLSRKELTEATIFDLETTSTNTELLANGYEYVGAILSSLITVSKDDLVQFSHQTVKDYLMTQRGMFDQKAICERFIGRCCLSYIGFCSQSGLKCRFAHAPGQSERSCLEEYRLLEYSINNWWIHASESLRDAEFGSGDSVYERSSESLIPRDGVSDESLPVAGSPPSRASGYSELTTSTFEWAELLNQQLDQKDDFSRGDLLEAHKGEACQRCIEMFIRNSSTAFPDGFPSSYALALVLSGDYEKTIQSLLGAARHPGSSEHSTRWPQTPRADVVNLKLHESTIQLLLEHGAMPDISDHNSWTAWHTVSYQGDAEAMESFLTKSVNVNIQDHNGQTALHISALQGHHLIIGLLLGSGADVTVRDRSGHTALDIAVREAAVDLASQFRRPLSHREKQKGRVPAQKGRINFVRTLRLLLEKYRASQVLLASSAETIDFTEKEQLEFQDRLHRTITFAVWPIRCLLMSDNATAPIGHLVIDHSNTVPFRRLLIPDDFMAAVGTARFLNWSLVPLYPSQSFVSLDIDGGVIIFKGATTIHDSLQIHKGTVYFTADSNIRSARIYNANVVFQGATTIQDSLTIYHGKVQFTANSNIRLAKLHYADVIFAGATTIQDSLKIHYGKVQFTATSNIRLAKLHYADVIFTGATTIQHSLLAFESEVVFSTIPTLQHVVQEMDVSSLVQIKELVAHSSTVYFTQGICREMMVLFDKEKAVSRRDSMIIGKLKMFGGYVALLGDVKAEIGSFEHVHDALSIMIELPALWVAVYAEHDALVRLLLDNGANPNTMNPSDRCTVLHLAALKGYKTGAELLLEYAADAQIRNSEGCTALQVAAAEGHTAIVLLLKIFEKNAVKRSIVWNRGRMALYFTGLVPADP